MLGASHPIHRPALRAVLVLALLLLNVVAPLSAAPAHHNIDHFDAVQGPLEATLGSPAVDSVSDPNILGGERDVQVTVLSGNLPREARISVSDSELRHSQDTGLIGQSLLQWDGLDDSIALNPNGLGGFDLTETGTGNAFAVTVVANDLPINLEFTVYSGTNASSATLALPGGVTTASPPVTFYLPFAAFTASAGSGASFTSVGAIELLIDGYRDSSDLTISEIRTAHLDWGDLPNGYGTTYASDGPRHAITGLYLGAQVDGGELEGIPTTEASGDDTNGSDDEDGVVPTPGVNWTQGAGGASINVTVAGGPGCLSGWIDWDGNGSLGDAGENVLSNISVNTGTTTHTFTLPVAPDSGPFYARFRLYPPDAQGVCTTTRTPTGFADGGEVEDYRWAFTPNAVNISSFSGASLPALPMIGGVVVSLSVLLLAVRRSLRG